MFSPEIQTNKLSSLYKGPYLINSIKDTTAYISLIARPSNLAKAVHFDRLSLCYPELPDLSPAETLPKKIGNADEEKDQ